MIDTFLKDFVVPLLPEGSRVVAAEPYRPGYRDYPLRLRYETSDGEPQTCVVKRGADRDRILKEFRVLRILSKLSLPVPKVIFGPTPFQDEEEIGSFILLSELPGVPLPWLGLQSLNAADYTCRLLLAGVARLHSLTTSLEQYAYPTTIPRHSLADELAELRNRMDERPVNPVLAEAVSRLQPAIEAITTPLVFSNGDYNPLNFLHIDNRLTGFIDFENACFEDPHIGFAKFITWSRDDYGWGAGRKAGIVERYLYEQNVSRQEFAPRLALRCLQDLLNASPDDAPDEFLLNLLSESLTLLKK